MRALPPALLAHGLSSPLAPVLDGAFAWTPLRRPPLSTCLRSSLTDIQVRSLRCSTAPSPERPAASGPSAVRPSAVQAFEKKSWSSSVPVSAIERTANEFGLLMP
jgi:hypothetical protein